MAAFMPTMTSDVFFWTELRHQQNPLATNIWPHPSNNAPSAVTLTWTLPVATETFLERKHRIARERSRIAIYLAKLLAPEPLPERLYDRERRVGRAVESRYRVMLC